MLSPLLFPLGLFRACPRFFSLFLLARKGSPANQIIRWLVGISRRFNEWHGSFSAGKVGL
jgi:hypothetical protein